MSTNMNTIINANTSALKGTDPFKAFQAFVSNFFIDALKNDIIDDEVFEKIVTIYEQNIMDVIYYTLLQSKEETEYRYQTNIIDGLNIILNKYNTIIKEWIQLNLIL